MLRPEVVRPMHSGDAFPSACTLARNTLRALFTLLAKTILVPPQA